MFSKLKVITKSDMAYLNIWCFMTLLISARMGFHVTLGMVYVDTSNLVLGANLDPRDTSPEDAEWHLEDEEVEEYLDELLKIPEEDLNLGHGGRGIWEGDTPLHVAAYFGHMPALTYFIRKGADLNARDDIGRTALHAATLGGRRNAAKYLLSAGADINAQDGNGSTPLHNAVSIQFAPLVSDLLSATNINPNLFNLKLNTPLHMAVIDRQSAIVALLVGHKALLELPSGIDGLRSFHLAITNSDQNSINILTKNGANINAKTFNGSTALHLAVAQSNWPMVKILLDMKKITVNPKDDAGLTPMQLAQQQGNQIITSWFRKIMMLLNLRLLQAANDGKPDVVKSALVAGADPNVKAEPYGTALHAAASNGQLSVVELLVESGVYPDIRDHQGNTALHIASRQGHQNIVQYLTREEVDINARDDAGMTALHEASLGSDPEIVRYLIEMKSNVNARDDNGWTPLHYSISSKRTEIFEELLKLASPGNVDELEPTRDGDQMIDLNICSAEILTPLLLAVTTGQPDVVNSLLNKGALLELPGKDGVRPFHLAAISPNPEVITVLSKHGANINAKTSNGSTALHLVADQGNMENVKTILNLKNVKLNLLNDKNQTPLQVARESDHYEIADLIAASIKKMNPQLVKVAGDGDLEAVKSLLDDGADVNYCVEDYEETPLYRAAKKGHADVVDYLLTKGANMSIQNHFGHTPLTEAADLGMFDVVTKMISHGADIQNTDAMNMTLLHWAAHGGNNDLVQFLLDKGALIDAEDNMGETPLHKAAWMNKLKVVQSLVESNADKDVQNNEGNTPLHWAAYHGHKDVFEYLVDKGANLLVYNQKGETPLDYAKEMDFDDFDKSLKNENIFHAVEGGKLNVLKYLKYIGKNISDTNYDGRTVLHVAAEAGKLGIVKYLVEQGMNVSSTDDIGETPLFGAAGQGQLEVVMYLMDHGANMTVEDNNTTKLTPLLMAASKGKADVVKYMVSKGAPVQSTGSYQNMTLLHWAAYGGSAELVQFLLDQGASINLMDDTGETPLHKAVWARKWGAVTCLVENGAEVNAQNQHGETPLFFATKLGLLEIAEYLLEHGANPEIYNEDGDTPLDYARNKGDDAMVRYIKYTQCINNRKQCTMESS